MKYFTKELWLGHNSSDNDVSRDAYRQSVENTQEYFAQLEKLQPRLSKRVYSFFSKVSLHDGRLIAFTVGDAINRNIDRDRFDINRHDTSVQVTVLGCNLDRVYRLRYNKVRRVIFDYPTETPLFHYPGAYIGDWGYDELTPADDEHLRHEVLFASGTTILIEFKQFSYTREKCDGSRYS